ncbi:MAG: 50S ribosomal protein L31e [Nanoarchaeota archaeon]
MEERTYNVPLRRVWMNTPRYRKAKKATTGLRAFIAKHMKAETVIICKELNEAVWERGIKNPPHHIKIITRKEDGKAIAQLFGKPFPEKKEKKEDKKEAEEAKAAAKPEEQKAEAKKEENVAAEAQTEKPGEAPKPEAKPKKAPVSKPKAKKAEA